MTNPAISIRNLGKRYRVNHAIARAPYRTLRDSLARAATTPMRRLRGGANDTSEDFWALRDVSFDVQPGEVVGIIGRNGAGKSTLLKILSRITKPTSGEVEINGRVGSLLEVGTGFHPELTGRENIYLNGSILGMRRTEVRKQFDTIVAFSGVERFLDTPVKRYSSGMYVRLAFSVAAHLNPEILLVDEVLAVGDSTFQNKCIGRMSEASQDGKTVVFVSHNMSAVQHLCHRVIALREGMLVDEGDPKRCITKYLTDCTPSSAYVDLRSARTTPMRPSPILRSLEIFDSNGTRTNRIFSGDALTFRIEYHADRHLVNPSFRVTVSTVTGIRVFTVGTRWNLGPIDTAGCTGCIMCTIPDVPLMPGEYVVALACAEGTHDVFFAEDVAQIIIEAHDHFGTGQHPRNATGLLLLHANWEIQETGCQPGETAKSADLGV